MADKPSKPQKLKARLPRGLADRGPAEIAATRQMVEAIRVVFERYGFEPVETPAIEYTDTLGKFLPDQDRPNEGVFSFQDDDEQWLSLRYDLTAPLARYVAERIGTEGFVLPFRSYRHGWVFRNEKPGPGHFRQFMQFDADTVGAPSMAADAEICMLAADTMESLGIKPSQYVVKVNNRKVLDGVMEAVNLGGDANAGKRLAVLRAIDKLDRLGIEAVQFLLGPGRRDESGDFTKGAGLNDLQITRIINFTGWGERGSGSKSLASANEVTIANFETAVEGNAIGEQGVQELKTIRNIFAAAGYDDGRIIIDPSVVRGLEYYTGPVYELELTFQINDEKGRPVRFGSVGGGGRYDGLVSRFRGEPVPATGFSIGVSRLQAALSALGKFDSKPAPGPVLVATFPGQPVEDAQRLVSMLRNPKDRKEPISAELYLGNPKNKLSVQFKYADRRHSPCVIMQGSDEKGRGEVVIKDLIAGTEAAIFHDAVGTSRQQYLEERPAQFAVKEAALVEAVRALLARHKLI